MLKGKVGRTKILYLDREKSRIEASTKYIYNMTTFYYLNILFHFLFNKYLWRIKYISAIVLGSGNTDIEKGVSSFMKLFIKACQKILCRGKILILF